MKRDNPFLEIYRKCNRGTNQGKYDLIQNGEVVLPRYIDVELTNHCNFRCCFCPTGTKSSKRARGYMSEEVADALVENVRSYKLPGVRFIGWGEPTLHPRYLEIMRRVKEAGAMIMMATNGSRLDAEQMRALLDLPLDSLKFSFQGADADSYNEMREGGDYDRLVSTVREMARLRGDRPYPHIQITTTLTAETAEQVDSFRKDVEGYCDLCTVGFTKLSHLNVADLPLSEEKKAKIRRLQKQENANPHFFSVCMEAFDKLSVNWNGDVTLCCSDEDNLIVGNILDMDLKQIFNSSAADAYRKMIVDGTHIRQIECCSTCYETAPLAK